MTNEILRDDLAFLLEEHSVIRFGSFIDRTDPRGPRAPFIVELGMDQGRVSTVTEMMADAIIGILLADTARGLSFDCLADVPYAEGFFGNKLHEHFRSISRIPLSKVQMYDGMKVVGPTGGASSFARKRCLLVDEASMDGKSTLDAISALRSMKVKVKDVIVLVDCMMGGSELLKNEGINLHAIYSIEELIKLYAAADVISAHVAEEAMDYIVKNR